MEREGGKKGWIFALPWIIGLSLFTLYPFCASIYYSFTDFSVLQEPRWIGAENFREIARDELFWKVLRNTLLFAALSIPASLIVSLSLALLMNGIRRGQVIYSVIFYLPQLVPPVAASILWMWLLNGEMGLINNGLRPGFNALNDFRAWLNPSLVEEMKKHGELMWAPPGWLSDPSWAVRTLVFMGLWGVGQTAFIYLAKLQDVPHEMYEAADIDGASTWHKVRYITLPMISPIIFFNIIMAIIGSFQIFTEPFLVFGPDGGVDRSAYFLPHYIFDNAFRSMRMGYACAMSWLLFVIILALTIVAFRLSKERVYYAGK